MTASVSTIRPESEPSLRSGPTTPTGSGRQGNGKAALPLALLQLQAALLAVGFVKLTGPERVLA